MSLGAHRVQSDGQSFLEAIRKEVDLGPKELANQGAGIIKAFDFLAGELYESRLSPISDQFDGVDEVFFL